MTLTIVDGKDLILGRLSSVVAKKLLNGENVVVLNAEKIIISGKNKPIIKKYMERVVRGDPYHGPFFPRMPDKIVYRAIRGMLPYKKPRGRNALKKLRVCIDIPNEYKNRKFEAVDQAKSNLTCKTMSIKKISNLLGKNI